MSATIEPKSFEYLELPALRFIGIDSWRTKEDENRMEDTISRMTHVTKVKKITEFSIITREIVEGNTVLLIEGIAKAFSLGTTGFDTRAVESTKIENVIKGPKEAFVESCDKNRSLIRKYVKNEKLVSESISLGERSVYTVSLMYIKDLADPGLVESVKKKIVEIQVDSMLSISILEQHIEERPYSLVPTVLYTERPDRAAAF